MRLLLLALLALLPIFLLLALLLLALLPLLLLLALLLLALLPLPLLPVLLLFARLLPPLLLRMCHVELFAAFVFCLCFLSFFFAVAD